ncbi:MAG: 50S ribosomal protein L29 [bacterium]|nr:50S ribosomal protein L29 [bacterium]
MKRDILQNLKEKSKDDLEKELISVKDRLWRLKVDLESGKVKNVSEIRKSRKAIAVINTLLKSK